MELWQGWFLFWRLAFSAFVFPWLKHCSLDGDELPQAWWIDLVTLILGNRLCYRRIWIMCLAFVVYLGVLFSVMWAVNTWILPLLELILRVLRILWFFYEQRVALRATETFLTTVQPVGSRGVLSDAFTVRCLRKHTNAVHGLILRLLLKRKRGSGIEFTFLFSVLRNDVEAVRTIEQSLGWNGRRPLMGPRQSFLLKYPESDQIHKCRWRSKKKKRKFHHLLSTRQRRDIAEFKAQVRALRETQRTAARLVLGTKGLDRHLADHALGFLSQE